ncbi:hypothetical protein EJ04DRAFT_277634 [Polyplosphaeria fusca]|uniref:Uncharacterized protein n=1 Tax=Polyplosphaeria fusca TaxID=682080 RepID=A0A9P4V1J2_9PLEO|nr:hypothetical protein EJ04DRAFT_277634 [Polyplosphaeria fusca]
MPPQPPPFGAQQYWEDRFSADTNPFEWLQAPTALDPYLVTALKETPHERPELLHIGCGTSLLSYHLRTHVKDPEQIHNLDYSEAAIRLGRKRELDIYNLEDSGQMQPVAYGHAPDIQDRASHHSNGPINISSKHTYMRWTSANLLSHTSLLQTCKPNTYSLIVDKSTSDSIACADDFHVPLPYPIGTSDSRYDTSHLRETSEPVYPLHILGIHMALLAKPNAQWITLSYSSDRYPFLELPPSAPDSNPTGEAPAVAGGTKDSERETDRCNSELDIDFDDIPLKIIESGLPDPGVLWRLQSKYEIEVPQQPASGGGSVTHKPKVIHWVYVLQRTDVPVFVRDPL